MTTDNFRKHTAPTTIKKLYFLQKLLLEHFYTVFLKEIKDLSPQSILDAGCGEGFTLHRLQMQYIGERLEGIDFLKTAIAIGRKQFPGLVLRQGDIYKLAYKDNSFDLVICSEVLEHLANPQKALEEMRRVTKKYCVISVPNEPWFMLGNLLRGKNVSRLGNDIEHINHWNAWSIKKFIGSKFTVIKTLHPLPWSIVIAQK